MTTQNKTKLFALGLSTFFASTAFSMASDCKTSLAELNDARMNADYSIVEAAIGKFKSTTDCSDDTVNLALTQTAAILAQRAQGEIANGNLANADLLLSMAPATHWLVQVSRADIAAKQDDRAKAAELYNASLDTILDQALTPDSEQLGEYAQQIAMLAQENTMLAGSTANLISRSDGRATGVYGALSRGLSFVPAEKPAAEYKPPVNEEVYEKRPVKSTYIPIKFATDSDHLGDTGKQEALKLAKFINSYHIKKIKLIGHTDERGSHEYNQDLSERRAHSLKTFLIDHGGVIAEIITIGRGEKEPPVLSDYSIYSVEQRQAIARRVELALD